ncbi:MAG TPA: hypothetical protein DHV14_00590 [Micrococcales bacterium]|uniref:LytR C-terminal domain-containing protein n=1 Tax=Miniimonas TaxID=947525 RepID=UPI000D526246|nr:MULTISPECIES: LytR C-terminal domain-containing protein [Miniimonas]HCX83647.1 hypothetical protein [Micrococcales bacterium]
MSSTQQIDEAARRKQLRRRHLLQRQTIIFGSITVVLVVLGLAALGVFLGLVPPPFDPDFTADEEPTVAAEVTPCPADGALPVAWDQITVNVYNGTARSGLAAGVGATLNGLGVATAQVANYTGGTYPETTEISTGINGVAAAYTVGALFPDSVILLDPARQDATVDVIIGEKFTATNDPATSALDPATPITGREGCTPLSSIQPAA